MHFYKIHIGDHLRVSGHCSMVEEGALLRLANIYFNRERALPVEKEQIYRLASARTASEQRAIDTVLADRFVLLDDGWHEKGFDQQISEYKTLGAKKAYAADMRWHPEKHAKPESTNADAMHLHSARSANQKPQTGNSETT